MHSFLFCLQQRSISALNKLVIRLSFAGLVSDISGTDFVWVCHERCVVGATIETRLSQATQFRGEPLKNQQPKGFRGGQKELVNLGGAA